MPTEQGPLNVFLCYAPSDEAIVRGLYDRLKQDGFQVWMNSESLLPGQDRDLEISQAVERSGAVVVCLSPRFHQAGEQQKEARLALDTAMEQPEGEIFIIPAFLEDCTSPPSLKKYESVKLFGDGGYKKLIRALEADRANKDASVTVAGMQAHPEDVIHQPLTTSTQEKPGWLSGLLLWLRRLRQYIDIKYVGGCSLFVALFVLVFGNNIYQQIYGYSAFAGSPTPTSTLTHIFTTPTATHTPIPTETSTLTVTPTATSTLVTPTFTVTPTVTATVVVPVALGEDWSQGCISTLWQPYPSEIPVTERGDGCWREPVHVFSAENGDLDFVDEGSNAVPQDYGFFAPLPENGKVTVTIRLTDLTNVDVLMGIFPEADLRSQGLLMIIPHGDVRSRVFVQKEPSNYKTIAQTAVFPQGKGFSVSFTFTVNSVKSTVNPSVFATSLYSIPAPQKWLFLGYKTLSGNYRIEGRFLSFELK